MQRHARSAVGPVQPMEVSMNPRPLLAGTVACAVLFASFAHAQSTTTDPGFVPDTGQINPGHALQPPPTTPPAPIANPADVRAALLMPDPGTISLGEDPNAGGKAQPATTGKSVTSGEQPGPIASTMQTKPAKFSHRNDVIDHMPTMGMPLRLDEKQRQQIFQAITSEKTSEIAATQTFKPADAVPYAAAGQIHPFPGSIRGIPDLAFLAYMKGKDRVYLVTTRTADPIVVDILDGK
ncbi:MAG TPA: hypothetical protein VGV41_15850 [Pseudolabrys sp.]|uniref:hypothetical protein n=1 Tax=Pseudolabrys sp. TaxID=1960880 RepID=UPI002DDD93F1|nr:hypothetical protein [Pseudolabrys sp.]HEV2630107.1 hypothetical protein [Pseudolabrys sp.]